MGLFNTSKNMLDAIKSVVTDGRKQYIEEQQRMDKLVAEKILSPKQKKIAAVAGDKDKIDAADFATLRAGKKVAEDIESVDEMSSKEKMKKGLYNKKVAEAKDVVKKDAAGKVSSWYHEGDWKKSTGKDPRGTVANLSDKARRKTEKMTSEETIESILEEMSVEELMDFVESDDFYTLDESIKGKIKHFVKGVKRMAAGKPSAGASERDADEKGRQKYADSEVHFRAAKDVAVDAGYGNKRAKQVFANRMSAGKYNMDKGAHQFRRADRIAALRDKVKNEDVYLEDYTLEEIQDFMMTDDFYTLDESIKGKIKHFVKGVKRMAAGKPSAGASERDADAKGRQRYADSEGHSRAAGAAAYEFGPNRKRVIANRMSAAKYNMEKGAHQFRRADKIAALRNKVAKEEFYLEDYSLEDLQDFLMSEEFEQLDELSKATLGSYVKKASNSLSKASHDLGDKRAQSAEVDRFTNRHMGDKFRVQGKMKDDLGIGNKAQEKDLNTVLKRTRGITKAANKLSKEQYEEIERDTPGNSTHQCAVHVKHSTFGEGKALYSQHANPDYDGNIEWYDIMFEHGIEKQVPTSDLEVVQEMSHGNHKKGKK